MNTYKHYVGDIVHSFCFVVRTNHNTGDSWPHLLIGVGGHPRYDSRYNQRANRYTKFLIYALRFTVSLGNLACYLIRLDAFTNQWRDREFDYADYLLTKYYGVTV